MREFLKIVCVLAFAAGIIAAAIVWSDDHPNQSTWIIRVGSPVVAVVAIAVFLGMYLRHDDVPDYLRQYFGGYLERGGFCLAVFSVAEGGVGWLQIYFQNRFDRACKARISFRAAPDFFGRRRMESINYEIDSEPAAFGVASIPLPIGAKLQGKDQKFEVGVTVNYPLGKGRMLRFRDGTAIRTNSEFKGSIPRALVVLTLGLHGLIHVITSRPSSIKVVLPAGVSETVPTGVQPRTTTIWKLGDPALQDVL